MRHAGDRRRIEPAAQITTCNPIGSQPGLDCFTKYMQQMLGIIVRRPIANAALDGQAPKASARQLAAFGANGLSARNVLDSLVDRTVVAGVAL